MLKPLIAGLTLLLALSAAAQQTPTPAAAEWWRLTSALANDQMQGRDTGTAAYEQAAQYVADQFAAYGLKPAGDNGTWFQRVPMHQIDLDLTRSSVEVLHFHPGNQVGDVAERTPIKLVEEITLTPTLGGLSAYDGGVLFVGYGDNLPDPHDLGLKDYNGYAALVFNGTPAGLTSEQRSDFAAKRVRTLKDAGFGVVLSVDNPAAIEPFHWPAAYSRSVTLGAGPIPYPHDGPHPVTFRISADATAKLFAHDPGHAWPALLQAAEAGQPLTVFALHDGLSIRLAANQKQISSPNILAILPGSDPTLAPEYVAISAHLDGYGFGTPVLGDNLYNGALDDAAYVATLLELAHNLSQPTAPRPKRSLLFCIFTGEEKGLLGSQYFTQHPTVPAQSIVADLNLDQLRPIFPLKILTMEGIADSTLGDTARGVAAQFGIELRPDREPERNLFRRADNYNFVRIGVPIASFIFGYDPGTPEERSYRDWYATRYHKPQDDLTTPIDWAAAVTFNHFYRALALAIADATPRPHWLADSPYAPKPAAASKTTTP